MMSLSYIPEAQRSSTEQQKVRVNTRDSGNLSRQWTAYSQYGTALEVFCDKDKQPSWLWTPGLLAIGGIDQ